MGTTDRTIPAPRLAASGGSEYARVLSNCCESAAVAAAYLWESLWMHTQRVHNLEYRCYYRSRCCCCWRCRAASAVLTCRRRNTCPPHTHTHTQRRAADVESFCAVERPGFRELMALTSSLAPPVALTPDRVATVTTDGSAGVLAGVAGSLVLRTSSASTTR